ncbi:MAG: protein-methionine-sulfoxide reductase catalytic subunit MsrP [Rhodospirillales bacterium]
MLIKRTESWQLPESAVTPREQFEDRRRFIKGAGALGLGAIAGGLGLGLAGGPARAASLQHVKSDVHTADALGLEVTGKEHATQYNNFYEFGTAKGDPVANAQDFEPLPWTVEVDGHVASAGTYSFDDLVKPHQLEERVYRFRCVEAWSMVVPWVGIPLADIIKRLEPTSQARYVAFQTLLDPSRMPGQAYNVIPWPYVEGLRMDEAMNPLTLMVVGMYGETLPNQNGAPLRLIVPWKYGFKSIKSIVKISFTSEQPPCTWNIANSREYGFYSNVNPEVDHPRWSQARERVIGTGLFPERRPTPMFNGYGEQVAHLYDGMDLRKFY